MGSPDTTTARGGGTVAPRDDDECDADARLARREQLESNDEGVDDAANEYATRIYYEAFSRHHQACQWLNVNSGHVTAEDLCRASLSDDPAIQVSRLRPLFEACRLTADAQETERADLIQTLADYGPRDERERQVLYHGQTANYMAMYCAAQAMASGAMPHHTAQHVNSFKQLSKHSIECQGRIIASRARRGLGADDLRRDIRALSGRTELRALEAVPASAVLASQTVTAASDASAEDGQEDAPDADEGRDLL